MTMEARRYCAVKVFIVDLVEGNVQQEPEQSICLVTSSGERIYRINLMGTVLHKEKIGSITNLLIDDGTGNITLRIFEESNLVEEIGVGSTVIVIGRVRVYNDEKYVSPDIIKKISPKWLKARSLELGKKEPHKNTDAVTTTEASAEITKLRVEVSKKVTEPVKKPIFQLNEEPSLEEEVEEICEVVEVLPFQKILEIIKEHDKGEGVMMEEVIEQSPVKETEQLLQKMLEKGEIFQIMPGRIKVL
ncbi:MAG: OB-fold nucleic acid binding domain-containing protein [Candidatus Woesearchaeota archaeon]